jgi:ketosteroid isomerase-like protein
MMTAILLTMMALLWCPAVGPPAAVQNTKEIDTFAIQALLERQQTDWNRGDVEAFMGGYERTPSLVFTSGGRIERGWEAAHARYRRTYPDRETMGQLTFSDVEVTLLGADAAVVLGRYTLVRKQDRPRGVFTLVLRRTPGGWKILHDHTSSAP